MTTEQTIAIILAIVVLAIILLVGCLTDLLRETNVPGKAYSFSRFQLFLWTMTILPIFSLHWGFRYYPGTDKFLIDKTGLILLGISSAVTLTSSVVSSVQLANKTKFATKQPLKQEQTSQGWWIDILTDDHGQFSVARLQQLVFTLMYIVIYVATFFGKKMALPVFDDYAFVLMGISTGSYVVGKSMFK